LEPSPGTWFLVQITTDMNLNNSKTKICQSTRVPVSANNTITQKLKSYYAEKLKPTPAT